jgi:hypothetical protein
MKTRKTESAKAAITHLKDEERRLLAELKAIQSAIAIVTAAGDGEDPSPKRKTGKKPGPKKGVKRTPVAPATQAVPATPKVKGKPGPKPKGSAAPANTPILTADDRLEAAQLRKAQLTKGKA